MVQTLFSTFLVFILSFCTTEAQFALPAGEWDQDGRVPQVFLIGQNETSYEKLMSDYGTMLLAVSENDMKVAYSRWIDLLTQMEAFSEKAEFDLKGLKLWLNVFWNEDGSIQHIVYHPKPNSRNTRTEDINNFFESFIPQYAASITSNYKFSHYGSAAFPTLPQRVKP